MVNLTSAALQRMKELGVSDRLEHEFVWWTKPDNDYPWNLVFKVVCRCGWRFYRTLQSTILTTASTVVREALTEHALWRTDPNHYTYYPAHAR